VKDKERTGNISRVRSEDIQKQPVFKSFASIRR
jgi:hypothetical protein